MQGNPQVTFGWRHCKSIRDGQRLTIHLSTITCEQSANNQRTDHPAGLPLTHRHTPAPSEGLKWVMPKVVCAATVCQRIVVCHPIASPAGGGGRLGSNSAQMFVSKSDGYGSFFSFRGVTRYFILESPPPPRASSTNQFHVDFSWQYCWESRRSFFFYQSGSCYGPFEESLFLYVSQCAFVDVLHIKAKRALRFLGTKDAARCRNLMIWSIVQHSTQPLSWSHANFSLWTWKKKMVNLAPNHILGWFLTFVLCHWFCSRSAGVCGIGVECQLTCLNHNINGRVWPGTVTITLHPDPSAPNYWGRGFPRNRIGTEWGVGVPSKTQQVRKILLNFT